MTLTDKLINCFNCSINTCYTISKTERLFVVMDGTGDNRNIFNGFVVRSYVQRVSERIGRVLKQQQVGVSHRPQVTTNSLFSGPKVQDDSDCQRPGIVYNISCTQCSFVFYGQTERPLKTLIAEHRDALSSFDHNYKVAAHVHQSNHKPRCHVYFYVY